MPTLPTQSFSVIVSNAIAGIQGRASKFINFSQGSSLRAIVEGFAGLFLWFQALVLLVLQASRLSTSNNVDVDTFTADFMPTIGTSNGVPSPRLGAQFSSGQLTYARFTAAPSTCFIPVGATSQTSDGSQSFVVTTNVSYATYTPTPAPGGYVLASSVASIVVPAQAVVAGAAGNVAAGSISTSTAPITGIDTVTNVAAFFNGADQEQDSPLKARFSAYILGLSRGDYFGLNAAILGAEATIQWKLTEGYNFDGSYHPGYFFVVTDDGSGTPSPAFLTAVSNAAQSVRPLSVQFSVFPPTVILANVGMQLTTATGYDHNTVVAQVAAAIAFNINSLGLGNDLPWSILSAWAYAIPGVTKVSNVLLNGSTGDAASIASSKTTQDRANLIFYITIKSGILNIS